jgi:hypothetical protein
MPSATRQSDTCVGNRAVITTARYRQIPRSSASKYLAVAAAAASTRIAALVNGTRCIGDTQTTD